MQCETADPPDLGDDYLDRSVESGEQIPIAPRLQHSGYPYRLLDLARYPAGYRVAWRWTDAGPAGTIAGPDCRQVPSTPGSKRRRPPLGTALRRYRTVVIWCRAFTVLFARAPLERA